MPEVLVALLLFLVISAGMFAMILQTSREYRSTNSQRDMGQAVRSAVEELTRTLQNAGFGIDRPDAFNAAEWQQDLIYAGSHAVAFNADIDSTLGPIDSSRTLTFPTGETYSGEGASSVIDGAETWVYSLDANGDDSIGLADRSASESGSYNPAALTDNPDDFALFLRRHGYDGSGYVTRVVPVAAHLFTNATTSVNFPDGEVPDPLFSYWVREDLNRDGLLDPQECVNDVLDGCPPSSARDPVVYLWGDNDFDGRLSNAEKDSLITLPVGAPSWSKNPLTGGGSYPSTTLSAAIDPTAPDPHVIEVASATGIPSGAYLRIGSGAGAERITVDTVSTSTFPHVIVLHSDPVKSHSTGEVVQVLPRTLLRAVEAVQIHFTAVTARRDQMAGLATPGQSGRATSHGMDYRTVVLRRTVPLTNLLAGALH